NILTAVKETLERRDIKNVVGYINKILEDGFIPTQTKVNDLPHYIVNQSSNNPQNKKQNTIDPTKQKEALDLLFKLGEITQTEYEVKLKGITQTR
ncbi:hypothetical protein U6S59_12205, partial [Cutibacterium acnes]